MENNKKEISADELLRQLKANLAQSKVQPETPAPTAAEPPAGGDTREAPRITPDTLRQMAAAAGAAEKVKPEPENTKKQIKYKFRVTSKPAEKAKTEPKPAEIKPEPKPVTQAASMPSEKNDMPPGNDDIDELMKKFLTPDEYEKFSRRKKGRDGEELRDNYREYVIPEAPKPKKLSESIRDAEAYVSSLDSGTNAPQAEEKSTEERSDRIERISVPRRNGRPDAPAAAADGETREFDSASVLDVLKKYDDNKDNAATKVIPAVKTEKENENPLEDENLRRINEFDETDVNLMIAFGMEDELAKTVGFDKANEIEQNLERTGETYNNAERGSAAAEPAFEFETQSQAKQIFADYKKSYRRLFGKLAACIVMLVLIFFYENIGMLGGALPDFLSQTKYTVVYTMVDLQLLLLCAALAWKPLLEGAKNLIKLRPSPESVTSVLIAMTVLYHIGVCVLGRGRITPLYNFPVAMAVFFTLCYDFMNLKREIFSFNIVSSKKLKYAMASVSGEDASLENEAFEEYTSGEPEVFRISKTGFVSGFFRRTGGYSQNRGALNVIISFALIICAVFFVLGAYKTGDARLGMTTAYAALIFAMPFSVLITFSYPFFKASHEAFDMDSAIVGDASLDEYSAASVVSFEDKDVFPSTGVKVKSVKVYGDNRIDRIIYNAASLFRVIGGPLADVFDIATLELGHTDDVEIVETDVDGIEAVVGGRHIYIGKEDYLRRCRFIPVRDDDDEAIENGGSVSIMYMVEEGEVAAKLYVEYVIDPDFEFILKRLYKAGVCVGIKTFDPNINDLMLNMRIKLAKYPVKILKCRTIDDITKTAERVDSGIVSKTSAKSLLQTLLLCDKVLHVIKTSVIVKAIAMTISVAVIAVVLWLGVIGEVTSFYAALYQLFWVIPMVIIAKLLI